MSLRGQKLGPEPHDESFDLAAIEVVADGFRIASEPVHYTPIHTERSTF